VADQIGGKTAATAATIDHAVFGIWNPHATKGVFVKTVELFIAAATACELALRRGSARGTAGSSVTAAREHDEMYGAAPQSGLILDLAAYTVQPTLLGTTAANKLSSTNFGAVAGAGVMWEFREPGVFVPAGAGLFGVTVTAVAFPVSDVNVRFDDTG
jgi:hypothetical protein